jgi:BCD family chlorophyll transporter-like MFS transporter
MSRPSASPARAWPRVRISPRLLPFADAASADLPLGRLLRLALFQVSVGMALVLLNGTLNRVTVVELGVPAWLVSLMVSLPLLFAPLRALVGFRSDHHRSALGWRRVPYIWLGTLLQFGGLAIMPFALIVLSGDSHGPAAAGPLGAALAFLLVGAGLHITQTAGLALATDLAPESARPRVVALLYVMLLVGMVGSSLVFGRLLDDFSQVRLIEVIQGAALLTIALNIVALWKQEARRPAAGRRDLPAPRFSQAWGKFLETGRSARLLVSVGLGTAGFSMQDILLEPYGGEVLGLGVGATTELTALLAGGTLLAFGFASRQLSRGADPYRLSGLGATVGVFAFAAVVLAAPLDSAGVFRVGTFLIGLGGGLFAVGTLIAAMDLAAQSASGLALGAWGAVQATAAGLAIALGGALRDLVNALVEQGALGTALSGPAVGYGAVYHLEILLLFATLAAIGPLVGSAQRARPAQSTNFGLAEFPG